MEKSELQSQLRYHKMNQLRAEAVRQSQRLQNSMNQDLNSSEDLLDSQSPLKYDNMLDSSVE